MIVTPTSRPARPRQRKAVATMAYRPAAARSAVVAAESTSRGRTNAARPSTPVVNAATVPNRLPGPALDQHGGPGVDQGEARQQEDQRRQRRAFSRFSDDL